MEISASIKKLFNAERITYRTFTHKRTYSLEQTIDLLPSVVNKAKVIRTEVLGDEKGTILAIVPLETKIDFTKLKKSAKRNLIVLSDSKIKKIFSDCETGAHHPFGELCNVEVFLDKSLLEFDEIYFRAGSQTSIVQLSMDDFLYLNKKSRKLSFVSEEKFCKKIYQSTANYIDEEYKKALDAFIMPDLSQMASTALKFLRNEGKEVKEILDFINDNTMLRDHILNYAKLPLFGHENEIDTMQDAIKNVLGFDKVSHIVLGVAAGKIFNFDQSHHIYMQNFWKHTLYCAYIAENITRKVEKNYPVDPCISYLSGLFHNFGFLLIAQLFQSEFKLLNRWLSFQPNKSIIALENRLSAIESVNPILRGGHASLGAYLLKHWDFPEITCVVAQEHHNHKYQGQYVEYVRIIGITNRLLRKYKIGDGMPGEISKRDLDFLSLTKKELDKLVLEVMSQSKGLEKIALSLAS